LDQSKIGLSQLNNFSYLIKSHQLKILKFREGFFEVRLFRGQRLTLGGIRIKTV